MNFVRALILLLFSYASLDGAIRQNMALIEPSAALVMFGFSGVVGLASLLLFKSPKARYGYDGRSTFISTALAAAMVMSGLCFVVPLVKVATTIV
jgi:hypothetical protein